MPTSTRWRDWLLRGLTCSIFGGPWTLGGPTWGGACFLPLSSFSTVGGSYGLRRYPPSGSLVSLNAREHLSCNKGPLRILLESVNYPYPRVKCVCSFGDTSCEKHQTSWPNQGTTTPPKGLHEAYAPPATAGQREPGYPWLRCYPRRELVPNTRVAS